MGKQVLLIKGSPRKNGNTSVMATRKINEKSNPPAMLGRME